MITSDRAIFDYLRLAWSMRRDLPDGAEEVLAELREEVAEAIEHGEHPDWISIREDLTDWSEEWGLMPPWGGPEAGETAPESTNDPDPMGRVGGAP